MDNIEKSLYSTIGTMLREERFAKKMTLTQVAELLHVTPMTVQRYEKGTRKISESTLNALCDIYGISSEKLLRNSHSCFGFYFYDESITDEAAPLLEIYNQLNDEGKKDLLKYAELISASGLYE